MTISISIVVDSIIIINFVISGLFDRVKYIKVQSARISQMDFLHVQ